MKYEDRISKLQRTGVEEFSKRFDEDVSVARLKPITEDEQARIDAIETTTPAGKLERYKMSCDMQIARYSIAMLENEHDDAYIAHLNRLIASELAFVEGIACYLGVSSNEMHTDPMPEQTRQTVGRIFVANAGFMAEFNAIKGLI